MRRSKSVFAVLVAALASQEARAAIISVTPEDNISNVIENASHGDQVVLLDGTYRQTIRVTSGITLRAQNPGKAIVENPYGNSPGASDTVQVSGSGITVQGLVIKGGRNGVFVFGATGKPESAGSIAIVGNTVVGAWGDGIKASYVNNLVIRGNAIHYSSTGTINDQSIDFVGVTDSVIEKNLIGSPGEMGSGSAGYTCIAAKGGSENIRIIGNGVYGCLNDGISVGGWTSERWYRDGADYDARNVVVTDNEVEAGKNAVIVADAQDTIIENNNLSSGKGSDVAYFKDNSNIRTDGNTSSSGGDGGGFGGLARSLVLAGAVAGGFFATGIGTAAAVVYATEVTQILNGLRLLEQIKNEIEMIENDARMLENDARMLQGIGSNNTNGLTSLLNRIAGLFEQTEGIGYQSVDLADVFSEKYPQLYNDPSFAELEAKKREWLAEQQSKTREAMQMQSQIKQNMGQTNAAVAATVRASQAAPGQTAAIQASNQLLAVLSSQVQELQAVLIAQSRAVNTFQADEAAEIARADALNEAARQGIGHYTAAPINPFTRRY